MTKNPIKKDTNFFQKTDTKLNKLDREITTNDGIATIQTSPTQIAHGLGKTPNRVWAMARGNAYIYEVSPPTAQFIYLQSTAVVSSYWFVKR